MRPRHPKLISQEKIFDRSRRDGTPSRRVCFYPTEKEVLRMKVIQRSLRYMSLSEMITEAVRRVMIGAVPYSISLSGKRAEHAETLAQELGYKNAEEWFQESIEGSVRAAWEERVRVKGG